MGLLFTLLYLFVMYIGPPILFGNLVQYHPEVVLAVLALICTIPNLQDWENVDVAQVVGMFGLYVAVAMSQIMNGWIGGAKMSLVEFISESIPFFFILLNCRKKWHLQAIVLALLLCATYTVARGIMATRSESIVDNPYVMTMVNSAGERFMRIRGVTYLNDPNDLSQFLIALMAMMFFLYRKGSKFRNLVLVYLPLGFLLYGMYLTHSRGAMVALTAAVVVAARKKIGLVPAAVGGGAMAVAMSALGWTGGRSVSLESGADRMDAWAAGLGMIKTHPLFGVGFARFTDFHNLTAHNTIVVCTAELGIFGLFFWMMVALPAVRNAFVGSQPMPGTTTAAEEAASKAAAEDEALPASAPMLRPYATGSYAMRRAADDDAPRGNLLLSPAGHAAMAAPKFPAMAPAYAPGPARGPKPFAEPAEDDSAAEMHRYSNLMFIAFAGFFTAGWFLSRAYTPTEYLMAGIMGVIYRSLLEKKAVPPLMGLAKSARLSILACTVLVIAVWLFLRVSHLMPQS